eukprot:2246646-Prymnesium_polylepis.1
MSLASSPMEDRADGAAASPASTGLGVSSPTASRPMQGAVSGAALSPGGAGPGAGSPMAWSTP